MAFKKNMGLFSLSTTVMLVALKAIMTPESIGAFSISPSAWTTTSTSKSLLSMSSNNHELETHDQSRRSLLASTMTTSTIGAAATVLLWSTSSLPAYAKLESVNRPDLLPSQKGLHIIQTEKVLTSGQAKRMEALLSSLERDTGFRIYVVCQNYPNTPGKKMYNVTLEIIMLFKFHMLKMY